MSLMMDWEIELLNILTVSFDEDPITGTYPEKTLQEVLDEILASPSITTPTGIDLETYVRDVFAAANLFLGHQASDLSRNLSHADLYTFILDFMSEKDPSGSGTALISSDGQFEQVADGFDQFTWLFLLGARTTNASANELIPNDPIGTITNSYNNSQYKIRTGEDFVGNAEDASNNIAYLIASDVIQQGRDNKFPSLYQLGQTDGQEGAKELWYGLNDTDEGPGGFGIDIGGWAGNPFFMVLRTLQFFQRDILYYTPDPNNETDDPNPAFLPQYQDYASGYDLLAWVQSLVDATNMGMDVLLNFGHLYDQLNGSPDSIATAGLSAYLSVEQVYAADQFLADAYGQNFSILWTAAFRLIHPVLGSLNASLAPHNMQELFTKAVGVPGQGVIALGINSRTNGDTIGPDSDNDYQRTTGFNDIIHAGFGDDTIIADGGADVIDGGEDFDTVDYARRDAELTYLITDAKGLPELEGQPIAQTQIAVVATGLWRWDHMDHSGHFS